VKENICELCKRKVLTQRHHLIPDTRHKNKKNKKNFTRDEVHVTIALCNLCHKTIHATFTEKQLEKSYNSLEKIISNTTIQKFVKWIKKRPSCCDVKVRCNRNKGTRK